MSLYNMLFGQTPLAPALLKILNIEPGNIPRYRDAYLGDEGKSIIIYTRTGGGNRDFYDSEESCRICYPEYFKNTDEDPTGPWNSDMQSHPQYMQDYDDDFDSTYAYFEFKVPEEWAAELEALAKQAPGSTTSPSEKWQALLSSLQQPQLESP